MEIHFKPTLKQAQAWHYLTDQVTNELLFGGAAGGAKSFLGCVWLIWVCLQYPGSRWLMGRATLKSLKESTLNTFFEISSKWNLKEYYDYNAQEHVITFKNGSTIYCKDLAYYPSDPNFDRFGSVEITGAFIDECNQVTHKCKEVIKSRIRYKLDEFNLIPKMLMTCNPAKNWVYQEFYKLWKEGRLPSSQKFIQAKVQDNPHISKHYVKSLMSMKDKSLKERLLKGNWEYDDDPTCLFFYDSLCDLFTNIIPVQEARYITCDVARKGADRTIIRVWQGLRVIHTEIYEISLITEVIAHITRLRERFFVPLSRVIVDEDGLGGGVVDGLGCKGFVGNASPIVTKKDEDNDEKPNFRNLRSQCYFYLSDYVSKRLIAIDCDDPSERDEITEELSQIKEANQDKDQKRAVIPKKDITEALGRSPDHADSIMMRMYFEIVDPEFDYSLLEITEQVFF